jgi:catechol 2,3-dioxygenase-like lactoylglutathione lyase family enzyme
MSTTATPGKDTTGDTRVGQVDLKLEVIPIPVSDLDRAKEFYEGLGWRLDANFRHNGDRAIQLTPPGSQCSIHFNPKGTPGSAKGMFLVVSDIEAARDDLMRRGVEVSEIFHFAAGPPGLRPGSQRTDNKPSVIKNVKAAQVVVVSGTRYNMVFPFLTIPVRNFPKARFIVRARLMASAGQIQQNRISILIPVQINGILKSLLSRVLNHSCRIVFRIERQREHFTVNSGPGFAEVGRLHVIKIGPAVYTVTTTSMAKRLAEIYGTQAHETGVGFKYVGPKMTETNAVIGGEESGGFGFGMLIPERDGLAVTVAACLQHGEVVGERELDVHVQLQVAGQQEGDVGARSVAQRALGHVVDARLEPRCGEHVLGHALAPLAPGLRAGQRLAQ